jgi:hypothetical protein
MSKAGQCFWAPGGTAAGAALATTPWTARHIVKELLKQHKLHRQSSTHTHRSGTAAVCTLILKNNAAAQHWLATATGWTWLDSSCDTSVQLPGWEQVW